MLQHQFSFGLVLTHNAIHVHRTLNMDGIMGAELDQGWGLLSQFPPFRYFPILSALSNHTLPIEYHVYIWQVLPQLSCGDTCQIWMWFEKSNMYFCHVEILAYGKINERSFSNPHPRTEHWLLLKSHILSAPGCGVRWLVIRVCSGPSH